MTRARRTLPLLVLVFGMAVAGLGAFRVGTADQPPSVGAVPAAHAGHDGGRAARDPAAERRLLQTLLGGRPAQLTVTERVAPAGPRPGGEPLRLRLPSQRVDATVVPVTAVPGGELGVPEDPTIVGWWRDGARPGSGRGTVVLDGHADDRTRGPGALFHLAGLAPGAPVSLSTTRGEQFYEVRAVRSYPKQFLPAEVFDRTGSPRLVLISCGGEFDPSTRHYADNIVAYAVPVGPPSTPARHTSNPARPITSVRQSS